MIGPYVPKEIEAQILPYWRDHKIWEQSKERNKEGKKFFFLQGPPYTSGRVHLGTAWNECLKDMALRYRRMKGDNVFDRHGYDMHGLPISRKVMVKFGLTHKEDIEAFGVEKFVNECTKFALDNAAIMNTDFIKLGIWLDFENAYMPVKNEYIEGVWWLVKRAHEEGRLYQGFRALAWCADCSTALAKHEQQYKTVKDTSIFLKFKVFGTLNEYLVVWTTTPWTIAFNLAVMVNPDLEYVKAKVEGEVWVLAKGLAGPVVQMVANKEMTILEEFKGKHLDGWKYEHPWKNEIDFVSLTNNPEKLHSVILSEEFVHLSAGSGLVHCAPGCGPEDYEVGHRNHLPPFNELDENGMFKNSMGPLAGKRAKVDDLHFISLLEEAGVLIAKTDVEHEYAHCERCFSPIIFRATKQWFFHTEDLKSNMIEANSSVTWVPASGKDSFNSWLENLRDNSITKQIHWGTPVPLWVNVEDEKDYIVIGSIDDLKSYGATAPSNLHKPWIDDVVITKDGKTYKRVPDVLDVWIDAGSCSWLALDYPVNKELIEEWYPADLILEAKEQVRLWFNMLMVASIIALKRPAFKAVYMHGMLNDVSGVKMSKSLGNIISPDELTKKHGADTLRYYCCGNKAGEELNFSWDEVALRHRNLIVLWNIHKFVLDYARELDVNPTSLSKAMEDVFSYEEDYLFSKLHSTLQAVTEMYDTFHFDTVPALVEELFLELSRMYIQSIREKSTSGTETEKRVVLYTLHTVLYRAMQLFAPVCPFITEQMFLHMKEAFHYPEASIHLTSFPTYDESKINTELVRQYDIVKMILQAGLACREQAGIGVRWPIKVMYIETTDTHLPSQLKKFMPLIKQQLNTKVIIVNDNIPQLEYTLTPDYKAIGKMYGPLTQLIVSHLTESKPATILKDISANGKYEFTVKGIKVDIQKEFVSFSHTVPLPYKCSSFSHGTVFINTESDPELEDEGYAREVVRRVQALRKLAGLQKTDSISLYIQSNERIRSMLHEWAPVVKEKVGAETILIGNGKPEREFTHHSEETVKGQVFTLFLRKE